MTESPAELAAVEQLLAESDSLRGWLQRLDDAANTTPDAVRQRVRSDYQHRLDQLTAGLRAHADVIASRLRDDRAEHAELQSRANAARDALAEAELRHAVGEYDRERFEVEHRRYHSDVETFQLSLDAVAERIARLEDIHAVVERGPGPAAITADFTETDSPPVEIHTLEATDSGVMDVVHGDSDGAAPLAVFEDVDGASRHGTVGDGRPVPDSGPLSFRPSGNVAEPPRAAAPARARPFDSAPPLGLPATDTPPRFVRPGERLKAPMTPAVISRTPEPAANPDQLFADEIVASGPPPDTSTIAAGRTLRCGECGAMNRPLEWYCEKCGAELTAM